MIYCFFYSVLTPCDVGKTLDHFIKASVQTEIFYCKSDIRQI